MQESLEVTVSSRRLDMHFNNPRIYQQYRRRKISESCDEYLNQDVKNFVLNLEHSRVINSIGISILIEIIEKVKAQNGKVAICLVTPTIAKTFKIMGLLKTATIHDAEPDAIASLS